MKKKMIITFILIGFIMIMIPPAIFIYWFREYGVSQNISDWGAFGSYFGGVIGTII